MIDQPVRWGILGCGAIAKAFALGVSQGTSGQVVAAGSRSLDNANAFADQFDIPTRHGSYEDLLSDDNVEAVYIATPHPMHPEWAIRAAEAGKHVLCEKPMAINHAAAMAMFQAAEDAGTFMMEAFMYRCHPQTAKLVEVIQSGVIGEIRMVRATFGFGGGDTIGNPDGRLFSNALGGGGILDVGCYAVSMSRLVAGAAAGKPFLNPTKVVGLGKVGQTRVDEYAAGALEFENGVVAQIATAVRAGLENTVYIAGANGNIFLPNPWAASRDGKPDCKIIVKAGGETQTIDVEAEDRTAFSYEADAAAAAIRAGKPEPDAPAMTWADTLGNLDTLDRWRAEVGVQYDLEFEEAQGTRTIANRPITRKPSINMKYGQVAGLDKQVSRFVMGCDNQRIFAHAAVMFDDWLERGGNAFDTSYVYGGGRQEILLGKWVKARGVRDDVVVTVKGAHTPRCTPELLVQDFHTSLERLQFDHADMYVMHRDNPDIPVGEFVDVMNELIDQGLIRGALGGSNWSLERFDAVNEYAKANGKRGMAVLNNNLSLARMVKPVWNGCVHVSDKASQARLEADQIANFSWSSQARGYFLPEHLRMRLGQGNFECWDAPDNQARRARAQDLAQKRGVSPINIAATYVLNQPFPSFALVGPRFLTETASTLPALDIELTADEIAYLWGDDA